MPIGTKKEFRVKKSLHYSTEPVTVLLMLQWPQKNLIFTSHPGYFSPIAVQALLNSCLTHALRAALKESKVD